MTHTTTPPARQTSVKAHPITVRAFTLPLPKNLAEKIESFLLTIFEYGDYSFRAALRGDMSPLGTTAMVAQHRESIVGTALALYPHQQQGMALLGPVAVDPNFRRRGIATTLINQLYDHLAAQGIACAYLAVKHNHPARSLYHQLGFQDIQGIVMRRLLTGHDHDDENSFRISCRVKIRQSTWSDYCGVQRLLIAPATMICFDYQRNLFSSRISPTDRFLSVFPDLMKQQKCNTGFTKVLVSDAQENVVGLAHVSRSTALLCRHRATLDFFVHDHFIDSTHQLLLNTIKQCHQQGIQQILCYVPKNDHLKIDLLKQTGAVLEATLPHQLFMDDQWQNTLIYGC